MEWIKIANGWYAEHTDHIDNLVKNETNSFPPCEEDINHPELWKPGSWRWFLGLGAEDEGP